jgi:hypothetical protein
MEDVAAILVRSDVLSLMDPELRAVLWEGDSLQTIHVDSGRDERLGVFLSGVQQEWSVSLVQAEGVTVDLSFDRLVKEENVCLSRAEQSREESEGGVVGR